jgi:hypothetical protein
LHWEKSGSVEKTSLEDKVNKYNELTGGGYKLPVKEEKAVKPTIKKDE